MVKKLPPDDQSLWENFIKNIRPLKNDKIKVSPALSKKNFEKKPILPNPKVSISQTVEQLHPNNLRSMSIEGQLDLHGFTQASAESALREFLKNAAYKKWRWVRIITGKGSPNNPRILREQTPKWLLKMPEFVTGYAFAKPEDGGTGAFYVKIRRKSKS